MSATTLIMTSLTKKGLVVTKFSLQGTVLSSQDLQRVQAEKAAAVLVLADKFSTEPVKEDLSNIMRVISMKNYSESTRCIVQLLYYSSKVRKRF